MKNKINRLFVFSLLIIFIFSFSSIISAQNFFYSSNQIIFLNIPGLNTIRNPFMINQGLGNINNEFQTPVKKSFVSPKKSCSGVTHSPFRSEINPFKKPKNPKEIEIEKLKINKTIPKMISQKELKKGKILEMLEKDSGFKEMYDYAKELGLDRINYSVEVNYDNGATAIISLLSSNDKKVIYLIKYSIINQTQSFLIRFEKAEDSNATYLTIFGKDWGITIDFFNKSIVNEWGHHSCSVGTCFWYGINWFFFEDPWLGSLCGFLCDPICTTPMGPFQLLTCSPCIGCIVGAVGGSILTCYDESCTWYPCLQDCTDQDTYSSWEYYCNGNNRMKHINHTAYKCSSSTPMEGSCVIDSVNSGWENDTCETCPCPYGCNQATGNCKGAITCYGDNDCGDSGWIGSPSCSGGDVWQTWRDYNCYNPGTTSSYCDYDNDYTLRQECTSGECSDGECVGDCESGYPWYCNENCWHCNDGDDDWSICCPDSGNPDWCCNNNGPYCDTNTGECDVCGGDYPYECNSGCWGCTIMEGFEVCCPSSGNPQYCCNAIASVCMSDGTCCTPIAETCNNQDDNCDGTIDNFSGGCGVGACAGGTRICTAGSWGSCSTAGLSSNETCNNIDDDCDGSVDESLNQECGTDIGECVKGTQTCSIGVWGNCMGNYVGPVNETCDSLDNNCNNITDEDNVCGDYPNATIIAPPNNYLNYNGNITFNCSIEDDSGLANITLYHSISGNMTANDTKKITGTSNSTTWTIKNIPDGTNFTWNCLVYDNDSHWGWSENGPHYVNISFANDTHKFYLKNADENLAWLGDLGNIVLKGSCFSGGTCDAPGEDSLIFRNLTNDNVAFINSTGDLCIIKGDCSDESATCNPARDAFIMRNFSDYNMSYIDFDGELCLTGKLYENINI